MSEQHIDATMEPGELEETTEVENTFSSIEEFVTEYLVYLYPKNVTTRQGNTWCPEWWKHPAAAVRFHALWIAWENFKRANESAWLAQWFVSYADPIMNSIFSEAGPFESCSVERGHTDERPNPDDHLPVTPAAHGIFN